jgi:hypothetical protein
VDRRVISDISQPAEPIALVLLMRSHGSRFAEHYICQKAAEDAPKANADKAASDQR